MARGTGIYLKGKELMEDPTYETHGPGVYLQGVPVQTRAEREALHTRQAELAHQAGQQEIVGALGSEAGRMMKEGDAAGAGTYVGRTVATLEEDLPGVTKELTAADIEAAKRVAPGVFRGSTPEAAAIHASRMKAMGMLPSAPAGQDPRRFVGEAYAGAPPPSPSETPMVAAGAQQAGSKAIMEPDQGAPTPAGAPKTAAAPTSREVMEERRKAQEQAAAQAQARLAASEAENIKWYREHGFAHQVPEMAITEAERVAQEAASKAGIQPTTAVAAAAPAAPGAPAAPAGAPGEGSAEYMAEKPPTAEEMREEGVLTQQDIFDLGSGSSVKRRAVEDKMAAHIARWESERGRQAAVAMKRAEQPAPFTPSAVPITGPGGEALGYAMTTSPKSAVPLAQKPTPEMTAGGPEIDPTGRFYRTPGETKWKPLPAPPTAVSKIDPTEIKRLTTEREKIRSEVAKLEQEREKGGEYRGLEIGFGRESRSDKIEKLRQKLAGVEAALAGVPATQPGMAATPPPAAPASPGAATAPTPATQPGPAGEAPAPAESMVQLKAPDGTVMQVPSGRVDYYLAKGAKRVS